MQLRGLNASGVVFGVIAGTDAWRDAGLPIETNEEPDWDSGVVFGTGILGVDKFRESIQLVDKGEVRRLGSTTVVQIMASGISSYLGGILGCGNQVTTNSSACTTGTEGVIMAYERISSERPNGCLLEVAVIAAPMSGAVSTPCVFFQENTMMTHLMRVGQ